MGVKLEPKSSRSAHERQEKSAIKSLDCTTGNSEGSIIPSGPPSLVDSGSEHSSDSMEEPPRLHKRTRTADLHPPFKVF